MKYKKEGKTQFTILEKGTKNKLRLPLPNNNHGQVTFQLCSQL